MGKARPFLSMFGLLLGGLVFGFAAKAAEAPLYPNSVIKFSLQGDDVREASSRVDMIIRRFGDRASKVTYYSWNKIYKDANVAIYLNKGAIEKAIAAGHYSQKVPAENKKLTIFSENCHALTLLRGDDVAGAIIFVEKTTLDEDSRCVAASLMAFFGEDHVDFERVFDPYYVEERLASIQRRYDASKARPELQTSGVNTAQ